MGQHFVAAAANWLCVTHLAVGVPCSIRSRWSFGQAQMLKWPAAAFTACAQADLMSMAK